jgi:hypothetical protein
VTAPLGRPVSPNGSSVPCADHPWRHVVEDYRVHQQLVAERRARAAIEP